MTNFKKVCLSCKEEFEPAHESCPKDGGQLVPVAVDPLVGTVFADKYQILKVLGSGGMSVIYQARHKYMERLCAVKLLHPFLVADASMFQRFQYEAKAASNLNHPNVVGVHDFGITNDGRAYLVMDYLSGEDLASILEREVILPEAQAREIFRQACLGLDHAHSKGVIHRDLKPSNLFLEPQDDGSIIVKLVDFGIAKISTAPGETESGQNLTRTGEVFGSPLYMSPEQCSGQSLDARSDIYSFGCVMFETVAGKTPLIGQTALDTMHKHLRERPTKPSEIAPRIVISQELEQVIMHCLEKRPEDRFESVAELYNILFGEKIPKAGSSTGSSKGASSLSLQVQVKSQNSNNYNTGTAVSTDGGTIVTNSRGQASGHQSLALGTPAGKNAKGGPKNKILERLSKTAIVSGIKDPKRRGKTLTGLIFSASFLSAISYIYFFWDGPATDKGTFFNRNRYLIAMGIGDSLKSSGNYQGAEALYNHAIYIARLFSDRGSKKAAALRAKLELYTKANDNANKEATLKEINQILTDRLLEDYAMADRELDRIAVEAAKLDHGNGDEVIISKQLDADLSAVVGGLVDLGRRLAANGLYDKQILLLTKACTLYAKFSAVDDPQLAKLKLELALSHWNRDEVEFVGPLIKQSLKIMRAALENKKPGARTIDLAEVLLKLGQFDRDRSSFDDAKSELNEALSHLEVYEKKNGTTPSQISEIRRGRKLLAETLNAIADLERQKKDLVKAESYRARSDSIKQLPDQPEGLEAN